MGSRPGFEHQRQRHGLIGPFSGRQLAAVLGVVVLVAVVLVAATMPLGTVGGGAPGDPRPTAYLLGPPTVGPQPGSIAPELAGTRSDGSTWTLTDVHGSPVRLVDFRGHAVWINFWASWCPPCQAETPILRETDQRYHDRGLDIIGISVQETNAADVAAYASRYGLDYTIAADLRADVFHLYGVYALPTQLFIRPDGVIERTVLGPMTAASAAANVEAILPPEPVPSASLVPSATQ